LLHISIVKISLTKLRAQGVDFDEFLDGETAAAAEGNKKTNREDDDLFGKPSPAMQGNLVLPREDQFFVKLRKLLKSEAAKIVAQPKVTTYFGRPTSFHSGGEFPVPVTNPQGMMTLEWKKYGREITFASNILDRETLHLEIRAVLSKVDPKLGLTTKDHSIPGLQTSTLDTACKIKIGQIAVFSGGRQSGSFDDSTEPAVVENANPTDAKAPATPSAAEEFALLMLIKPEIVDSRNAQPEYEMPLR
jgi:Flp pilus assembly secretin CpaC